MPDIEVAFTVTAGGGTVQPAAPRTGRDGVARTAWMLGTQPGPNIATAQVPGLDPLVFTADARPGAPADLIVVAGTGQTGTVGAPAPDSLVVLVTDRFRNPVPGIKVAFTVTGGGGTVNPPVSWTGPAGIARAAWMLGPQAGPNAAAAEVAGIARVEFTALAEPGPPALVQAVSGDHQVDTVAAPLSDPLVVAVTDAYGNPLAGQEVEWSVVTGGGSVSPTSSTTDAAGHAQAVWTLGTQAGEQQARATAGAAAFTFSATARAGAPAVAAAVAGDGQAVPVGTRLNRPLTVRVTDAYGNAVAGVIVGWDVAMGGGSVDPASSVTDAAGEASTWLTVGPSAGPNRVIARAAGLPDVAFEAAAMDPLNLSIAAAYLVQSTQTLAGDVPLVAGRDAYLRAFVVADRDNTVRPKVRVELFDGGTLIASETVDAMRSFVPTVVSEGSRNSSWNLRIDGALVKPGLAVRITVDPDDDIVETDEEDNVFPPSGAPLALDVRPLPTFNVRFVPVRIALYNRTGDVTEANKHDYVAPAAAMFPIADYDADVHAVFTSSVASIAADNDWFTLLTEIFNLRNVEGSTRYYYGVIPWVGTSAWGGMGFIGYPVAVGLENLFDVAAHEWGHNFGRLHVGCGDPSNPDPNYPYPNGSIGVYGYDLVSQELKPPTEYRDLMSYCSPEWISDYTYRHVLAFRENEARSQGARVAAPEPTLVVWGRMDRHSLVLEPAFEVVTRPALPAAPGPYTLQGLDATGGIVFELSFAGTALADGPAGVRFFAFSVPASLAQPQRIARLRLAGPGVPAAERMRTAAAQAPVAAALEAIAADEVRMRWNAGAFPLAVARDPRTGEVLAFTRGGTALLRTDAPEIELIFSDGIVSTRRSLPVQR